MDFLNRLDQAGEKNDSLLCVGLDIDLARMPKEFLSKEDPIFSFNKMVVDKTRDLVCAYKPNIAFYEMYGIYGLQSLIKTIEYIPDEIPVILDAKRGDVGHTAGAYAKSAFEVFKADATTVNPYLGYDSIKPFLEYRDRGTFILCLTSNAGYRDFQDSGDEKVPLYIHVAKHVKEWDIYGNCGLVAGATNPGELKKIREIAVNMPILIPGIGAQGGDLEQSVRNGITKDKNRAVINSSRSIIYSDDPAKAAKKLRDEINRYR
ncbi:MAG: orotidine-5'-phosphate decarboxylase [Candidatus Saganbacteria bacterium]|nr:orotidine-5'-phosphate decarboxylase [Candidatus Saganbacteria bacterium]